MKKIQNNLKLTVIIALLCAISIVAGKYLAIRGGEIMRFSLENMPVIFAGMAFGPVAGVLVGVVSDLIGCVLVGYTINPLVTVGAGAIGLVSGLMPIILKKANIPTPLMTAITVASAHIIGSVIIKTIGLYTYYTMPFTVLLLWRVLNYLIVGGLDGGVVYVLLRNKEIKSHIQAIKGGLK